MAKLHDELHESIVINRLPTVIAFGASCQSINFTNFWDGKSDTHEALLPPGNNFIVVNQEGTLFDIAASNIVPKKVFVATFHEAACRRQPDFASALTDLRSIVGAIRGCLPLPSSPDFDELLTRATQSRGTPDSVKEWSHQLAADVGDLTD